MTVDASNSLASPPARDLSLPVFVLLACALVLLARFVGPLAAPAHLLMPLPLLLAGLRQGLRAAATVSLLAMALQVALSGLPAMLFYLAAYGGPTLLLVALLRQGCRWPQATLGAVLLSLAGLAGLLLLAAGPDLGRVDQLVGDYVMQQAELVRQLYQQAELSADQRLELLQVVDQAAYFFRQTFPAIAVVGLGLIYLISLSLALTWRVQTLLLHGPLFTRLRVAESLIWLLILAGFALLLPQPQIKRLALNLLVVLLPLYFLQGLAIISHYLQKKGFSLVSRAFVYTLVVVFNPLPLLVTAMGVFDLWFDFRKPRVKTS